MKKQVLMPLVALTALILVSLACGTPSTPPPAPTQPPPPTQIPVQVQPTEVPPTEPPTAAPTEAPAAPDYFTEEFDGDISNWTYFISKNDSKADDSGSKHVTDNGFLVFDIAKNLNVYAVYQPYNYKNVQLDVRVDNRGTNNNNINLVCRLSDEGWYEVSIANNGLYWIWAYDGTKNSYAQLANGGSNKIRSGKETNEYTLICKDRIIKLLINGVETRAFTDNQYVFKDGQIGIGLSSFDDTPTKVEYDWVKISEP
ncbi:MAG TPA: family 16 glycoside hydrolase [Anaerolineales bacterium]